MFIPMKTHASPIHCDGCGAPASPEHLRARVERLERATKYRPIHIQVLFVALSPDAVGDFYSGGGDIFTALMASLEISPERQAKGQGADAETSVDNSLLEFQRRGFYLAYLSECPTGEDGASGASAVLDWNRLTATLATRIRFNYRPKHVALLGNALASVAARLASTDLASLLLQDQGSPLSLASAGDAAMQQRFRDVLSDGIAALKSV